MGVDPFIVNVARLRRTPGARRHEVRHGPAELVAELAPATPADSSVTPGADAVTDLVLESYPGGVMVTGTVSAPWQGVCRRCTVVVGGELAVPVRERYVAGEADRRRPDDEEAYPLVDDQLDLKPLVRDALLLELPLAPLCTATCAGLCPTCGADRNIEECACVAPRDLRWANLDVLR